MVQQLTMTVDSPVAIKPLVESAIRRELKVLAFGIARTEERLKGFEARYDMSSIEFEQRFNAGEIGDDTDFIEWAGEIDVYALLQKKQQALQDAKLN